MVARWRTRREGLIVCFVSALLLCTAAFILGRRDPAAEQLAVAADSGERLEDARLLCMGISGRLNNWLLAFQGLLKLAQLTNRTAVMPTALSRYFQLGRLRRAFGPAALVSSEAADALCAAAPRGKTKNVLTPGCIEFLRFGGRGYATARWRELCAADAELALKLRTSIESYQRVRLGSHIPFYLAVGVGIHEDLEARFFRALYFSHNVIDRADELTRAHTGGTPFAAVHLRFLEGDCAHKRSIIQRFDREGLDPLCAVGWPLVEDIMRAQPRRPGAGGDWEALPLFVADDGQRPDVRATYEARGAPTWDTTGDGVCDGDTGVPCVALDMEIAARSIFFVGSAASTLSRNVESWRRYRGGGRHWLPGVLVWPRNGTRGV